MIRTQQLRFAYNAEKQFNFPDIDLNQGDQALLLGPSGSGKSTYLNIIGGLNLDFEGKLEIANQTIEKTSKDLDQFRGKNIGVIFQESYLIESLSVWENLKLRMKLSKQTWKEELANQILEELGIHSLKNRFPKQLSIGERQRVAIANAVISQPKVILADEPTSALDDHHAHQVIDLLKMISKKFQSTLLIITHDARIKDAFENQIELVK